MLKLIKSEYRKDIVSYIVVLSTMVVLEAYLGLSLLLKSNVNVALASVLFVLCFPVPYVPGLTRMIVLFTLCELISSREEQV